MDCKLEGVVLEHCYQPATLLIPHPIKNLYQSLVHDGNVIKAHLRVGTRNKKSPHIGSVIYPGVR